LNILTWTHLGKRTLKVVELQHALAVKPEDTSFDPEGISSEEALVECCLGLAVIETETSTIRLTHFTLREYFDKHWQDHELFPSGHSTIAATCLSYLEFDHELPPPPNHHYLQYERLENLKKLSPLIPYVAYNLGHHLETANDQALAHRCIAILNQRKSLELLGFIRDSSNNNTPLHWAADFGCTPVVKLLIATIPKENLSAISTESTRRKPYEPAFRTTDHHLPLNMTARGEELLPANVTEKQTVDVLLKTSSIDINTRALDGQTPFSLAAQKGHEAVARLLVDVSGAEISHKTPNVHTPLSLAARNGHEAVIRLLLDVPGVDINHQTVTGHTPLSLAARSGREEIVRLLLNSLGIDINARDNDGDSPILLAATEGHEAIVRLLLSTLGVDINVKNNKGETPLSVAAGKGHETIVQLLLAAGATTT
jgi:ankyrin repeat protein